MFCQQLHTCFYLIVVCSSIIGRVSFDSHSGLVALCYQSSYLFCPVLCVHMYVGESVCFDGITDFAVVIVSAFSELQAL